MDEWSARRRDLYLTAHNIHNRQTSMPPVGFEPTISAGERPQTYELDRAATGTSKYITIKFPKFSNYILSFGSKYSFCTCVRLVSSCHLFLLHEEIVSLNMPRKHMGKGCTAPPILTLSANWWYVVRFTLRLINTCGNRHHYSFNRRMAEHQSLSGWLGQTGTVTAECCIVHCWLDGYIRPSVGGEEISLNWINIIRSAGWETGVTARTGF